MRTLTTVVALAAVLLVGLAHAGLLSTAAPVEPEWKTFFSKALGSFKELFKKPGEGDERREESLEEVEQDLAKRGVPAELTAIVDKIRALNPKMANLSLLQVIFYENSNLRCFSSEYLDMKKAERALDKCHDVVGDFYLRIAHHVPKDADPEGEKLASIVASYPMIAKYVDLTYVCLALEPKELKKIRKEMIDAPEESADETEDEQAAAAAAEDEEAAAE